MRELKTFIIAADAAKTDSVIDFVFDHTGAEDIVKMHIINCPEMVNTFLGDAEYKMKLMVDTDIHFEPRDIYIDFSTPITQARIDRMKERIISEFHSSETERVYVYIDIPEIPIVETLKALTEVCTIKGYFIGENTTADMKKEVK